MHIGMVGLGKMGANMRDRLRAAGHDVTGYDTDAGRSDVATLAELVGSLPVPRLVWVMVPAGEATSSTITELAGLLGAGDLLIDGGNSSFQDDAEHEEVLAQVGAHYIDAGISGGVWGARNGYGIMVGGTTEDVERAMPVFDVLRPEGPREEGFVHAGPVGAGHFTKMVHNGIEYGLMQAYAEGYEILGSRPDLVADVAPVLRAWQRGTVVRSWLLELFVAALDQHPELDDLDDYAADSGEGRWTLEAAVAGGVPAPVLAAALFARFGSQQEYSPALKAVAALREQFGGHAVQRAADG